MKELTSDIKTHRQNLLSGKVSCLETVRFFLGKIEETQDLNIFSGVFKERALAQAESLDKRIKESPDSLGKLAGVIISIKDNLCLTGEEVSAASKILEGFTSPYTATAVERLEAEDAIIIGRTNCDEFAMGSANEHSFYGPTKNPVSPEHVPGGSSGGAAASVIADCCHIALGSDTGGSVRQPAGFCGIYGIKPTYGRVSRHGLLAYASSFDQIGVLGKNIEDVALALEIISGEDPFDTTCAKLPVPAYSRAESRKSPMRIAYFKGIFGEGIDQDIKDAFFKYVSELKEAGNTAEEVDFSSSEFVVPTYYVLTTAEASSNLSRYDGVRFGYRHPEASTLEEVYRMSRTEGFGKEVKKRIMLGNFVLSSGYYDAYYQKAQRVRRNIQNEITSIFQEYDFILLPVSPVSPWKIGEKNSDPVSVYLSDIFTVTANLAGIPAVSFPVGKHANGLPIGLQLMAPAFKEEKLITFLMRKA